MKSQDMFLFSLLFFLFCCFFLYFSLHGLSVSRKTKRAAAAPIAFTMMMICIFLASERMDLTNVKRKQIEKKNKRKQIKKPRDDRHWIFICHGIEQGNKHQKRRKKATLSQHNEIILGDETSTNSYHSHKQILFIRKRLPMRKEECILIVVVIVC